MALCVLLLSFGGLFVDAGLGKFLSYPKPNLCSLGFQVLLVRF